MKRNMELIRKILFEVEENVNNVSIENLEISGYTMEEVAYHCAILFEGGYLHDYEGEYGSGELYAFGVSRLTWEGHNYLDKIRDDKVWNKTKAILIQKGLPIAFDVVKNVASKCIADIIMS